MRFRKCSWGVDAHSWICVETYNMFVWFTEAMILNDSLKDESGKNTVNLTELEQWLNAHDHSLA